MQQTDIHQFLRTYFTAHGCNLTEDHPSYLKVQLTIDMDKELMNRPFYWHYIEKTGGEPNPASLTFITDPTYDDSSVQGEKIHFGSPRLHQIFGSAQKFGGFVHLYEKMHSHSQSQRSLQPWLALNMKVSYKCDRKKDELLSLGLNLITGVILDNFQLMMSKQDFTSKIPDYCFTLSPIIRPKSGISRLSAYVEDHISKQPMEWAKKAQERWYEDLALLDHFYENMEEVPESYTTEKQALQDLYEPVILTKITNGGLFYLSEQTVNHHLSRHFA
ncbi:YqhG family protein [Priestia flexa]|uniref:YqhG family protein n=1 Tax=Priestia flexa TaxID=86664 RepID=UPI001B32FAF9|nr:YqhG family protein [Priestia flexa]